MLFSSVCYFVFQHSLYCHLHIIAEYHTVSTFLQYKVLSYNFIFCKSIYKAHFQHIAMFWQLSVNAAETDTRCSAFSFWRSVLNEVEWICGALELWITFSCCNMSFGAGIRNFYFKMNMNQRPMIKWPFRGTELDDKKVSECDPPQYWPGPDPRHILWSAYSNLEGQKMVCPMNTVFSWGRRALFPQYYLQCTYYLLEVFKSFSCFIVLV